MIELIGLEGTREFAAAKSLYDAFIAHWPDLLETPSEDEHVKIASDVKIANAKRTDIDVVVAGFFKRGRTIFPKKVLRDSEGKRLTGNPISVQNVLCTVEVKDQGPRAVRIVGDKVEVHYSRGSSKGWHNATGQNVDQAHVIKDYFADLGANTYVHRCLIMQGLDEIDVDTAVAAGFTATDFFTAVCAASPPRAWKGNYSISSCRADDAKMMLSARIFEQLVPSSLDRLRMDRLLRKGPRVDQIVASAGEKFTSIRGHGGTGKTVTCLQAAWRAYKENADRTLVLTYNHSLAADIRRLLALMGVPSGEEGGIKVQTTMSFFYSWLSQLGVSSPHQDGFEDYRHLCAEALELIDGGALSRDDTSSIKARNPAQFEFDRIVVDEAQDSPTEEVALLKALYPLENIVISDGLDQLVRGERAHWLAGIPKDRRLILNVIRCLRMKRNLAVFASDLADNIGLNLDIIPNDQAGGGRVIIVQGPWSAHRDLHEELSEQAREAKNEPVDSLFCVPSDSVVTVGDESHADLAKALEEWGLEVWDGTDGDERHDFPRSTNQHRVVNYHSCRGLEGWNVILERLDKFWAEKLEEKFRKGPSATEADSMMSNEQLASREAWRWVFIALTRPIDTLVITLDDLSSPLAKEILSVADSLGDIVDNRTMN